MTLPVGTVLGGRFRVEGILGVGGMGTVYRASDARLGGHLWAVKEMRGPEPGDPTYEACLRGFKAEAELLSTLHHPRLPRVVDFFGEAGREYLVMDLVTGRDLRRVLEEDGPPPVEVGLRWGISVARVLEFLHGRIPPVVVRDLKPSNLVLTPSGDVVLVDFGIARTLLPDARTSTLAAGVGSPGYAPPEQYGRGGSDPRGDLYALGATLYHVLTGHEPHESVAVAAGLARQEPPSRFRPLPPGTDEVILRAMAPRLEDRPSSATELRADLERLLEPPGDAEANRRALLADLQGLARPPAPPLAPAQVALRAVRRRFEGELGWVELQAEGFELLMEGPGMVAPLVAVSSCGELTEALAEELLPTLARRLAARGGLAPRSLYLVVPAERVPNPVSVAHLAGKASSLRGWRRLFVLPLDLARGRLLDSWVPAAARSDNDLRDPLLNLGSVAGALRS